jgi:ketosteroid isomerase-like protein
MSQEYVEIVKAGIDAYNRRDFDAWLTHFDPEVVWWAIADEPEPGPFHGYEAVMNMITRWLDLLPDVRFEAKEYIDAGEYVILPARICGHVAGSDADVVVDQVFVDRFLDGKIVEVREYRTREEALAAVGLSEQDAHADS